MTDICVICQEDNSLIWLTDGRKLIRAAPEQIRVGSELDEEMVSLEKATRSINISEVLSAVEEKIKTVGCEKHSKKGCNGKSAKCITHNLWDELEDYINIFFEKKKTK